MLFQNFNCFCQESDCCSCIKNMVVHPKINKLCLHLTLYFKLFTNKGGIHIYILSRNHEGLPQRALKLLKKGKWEGKLNSLNTQALFSAKKSGYIHPN